MFVILGQKWIIFCVKLRGLSNETGNFMTSPKRYHKHSLSWLTQFLLSVFLLSTAALTPAMAADAEVAVDTDTEIMETAVTETETAVGTDTEMMETAVTETEAAVGTDTEMMETAVAETEAAVGTDTEMTQSSIDVGTLLMILLGVAIIAFIAIKVLGGKGSSDANGKAFAATCGPMWGSSVSRLVPAQIPFNDNVPPAVEKAFAATCGPMWSTNVTRNA